MDLSWPIHLTDKADDIYSDYLEILAGFRYDATKIKWSLDSAAKFAEYESWESHMERGFAQCHARDSKFGGFTKFLLAHRRVDTQVVTWWREERSAKGITVGTSSWEDLKQFLRTRFLDKSVESDKAVVPEVQAKIDGDDTPLRGMSIQLHKLSNGDDAVRRNQRCSLFQTQCTIKEKACKLIINSGSYCNGISRAMVVSLGLSTWRIPEPKHVEWLNSCGMLKVTHKVRVPFIVGDYIDEVECDVLPLEVCGLLLGRPW
jgi:hypothetical protein